MSSDNYPALGIHIDRKVYGNEVYSPHELWIAKSRYNHDLEMGDRSSVEDTRIKLPEHLPELIRGVRERLNVDANPKNLPYYFDYQGWDTRLGLCFNPFLLCGLDNTDNSDDRVSEYEGQKDALRTDKSRRSKKQKLFPALLEPSGATQPIGRRRVKKSSVVPKMKPLSLDLSFIQKEQKEELPKREPVKEAPMEIVNGELTLLVDPEPTYSYKSPSTPHLMLKYAPEYVNANDLVEREVISAINDLIFAFAFLYGDFASHSYEFPFLLFLWSPHLTDRTPPRASHASAYGFAF